MEIKTVRVLKPDEAGKHQYLIIPVQLNTYLFSMNGLSVGFEETADSLYISGTQYNCTVYKSQYKINGAATIVMTPEGC